MAIGPDGGTLPPEVGFEGMAPADRAFLAGLEGVIDRSMRNRRPGERVVFGVHQELAPEVGGCLVRRYLAAGWRTVRLVPTDTGAATLFLAP